MPKSKGNNKPRPSHNKRVMKKVKMAQSLNPFIKTYIEKLEKENEIMKTNPDTAIGQLITQTRDAVTANKRLSVLAAALIEAQGCTVTVPKDALTSFESKVLNIKWAVPEGVTDAAEAEAFIFSYEATEQPDDPNQPQISPAPDDESVVNSETPPIVVEAGVETIEPLDAETTLGEINEELEADGVTTTPV